MSFSAEARGKKSMVGEMRIGSSAGKIRLGVGVVGKGLVRYSRICGSGT